MNALKVAARLGDVPEAVAIANLGLSSVALMEGDRETAARRLRRGAAAGAKMPPSGNLYEHARGAARTCAENLAVLEAMSPEEKAAHCIAMNVRNAPGRVDRYSYDHDVEPVPRPACDACGATPLTLLKCGGSCGGVARYCTKECGQRNWKAHKAATGCRNTTRTA